MVRLHSRPMWSLTLRALQRLPQGALSRTFGRVADVRLPRALRPIVLGGFARGVRLDLDEAERARDEYTSIGDLFVRRLRRGSRDWPSSPMDIASPVDGVVGQFGTVRDGRALQAKGRDYSIAELLDDADAAARYEDGSFVTIYLSPRHYHRIHTPCPGRIRSARHVPGGLLPVNRAAVHAIDRLFPRNERLICHIEGPPGHVALVAVGAFNVGRITAEFERLPRDGGPATPGPLVWTTNRSGTDAASRHYAPPVRLRHSDEVMAFQLGSTVVLLFEPRAVEWGPSLEPGDEVRVGDRIARVRSPEEADEDAGRA